MINNRINNRPATTTARPTQGGFPGQRGAQGPQGPGGAKGPQGAQGGFPGMQGGQGIGQLLSEHKDELTAFREQAKTLFQTLFSSIGQGQMPTTALPADE